MKHLSSILLLVLSAALGFGQAAPGVGAPGVSASSVAGGGGGGTGTVTQVSVATTATTTGSVATDTTTPVISINVIPTPSVTGNSLVSGGGVGYVSGLNVTVGAASYIIQGTSYTSPLTNLSASAADPTNPRFDTVALNSSGAAVIITGTPSATPVVPQADPDTQLYLTSYLLAANATSIPVTTADIYFENTEWTMTKSGVPINLASTSNPYSGTVDIEATAAVAGNSFTATKPAAGTFDPATYNTLFFYIRNKAAWANAKSITIQFLRSGAVRGSPVTFKNNTFGFNSQTGFTAYQQIAIPTSAFAANGVTCDAIRFSVLGGGGSIGFYVDAITLQSGISPYETSTKLHWAGNYSATVAYNINDVVLSSNIQYVAIQAGVGHTPASSTDYWAPSSAAGGTGTVTSVSVTTANGVSGSVATSTTTPAITLTLGAITPTSVASAGAISGTNITASGIGAVGTTTSATTVLNLPASTTGVSPLRIAHGSAPTVPVNGDFWSTTSGFFGRVNGSTVGPFGAGGGSVTVSGTPAITYVPVWTSASDLTGTSAFTYSSGVLSVVSAAQATLALNGATGSAGNMVFKINSVDQAQIGVSGAVNGYSITGSAIGDLVLFGGTSKKIYIAPDAGSTQWLGFSAAGQISSKTGTIDTTSNLKISSAAQASFNMEAAGGSASNIVFKTGGVDKGQVGTVASSNGYITGTAAGDMVFYCGASASVWMVPNGGASSLYWKVNSAGQLSGNLTTATTSGTTGSLVNAGGFGNAGAIYSVGSVTTQGGFIANTIGGTLVVKAGTNSKAGTFTLAAGAATVSNNTTTSGSVVVMTLKTAGGAITAAPYVSSITVGSGFNVTAGAGDTSTYNYVILETN